MAPSNGTTSTPPKLVVTLPNHSTLQWHPPMAPSTLHPAMAPLCHVQSAKVVRRPPPPIGSENPYSYRYLGKLANCKDQIWHKNMVTLCPCCSNCCRKCTASSGRCASAAHLGEVLQQAEKATQPFPIRRVVTLWALFYPIYVQLGLILNFPAEHEAEKSSKKSSVHLINFPKVRLFADTRCSCMALVPCKPFEPASTLCWWLKNYQPQNPQKIWSQISCSNIFQASISLGIKNLDQTFEQV